MIMDIKGKTKENIKYSKDLAVYYNCKNWNQQKLMVKFTEHVWKDLYVRHILFRKYHHFILCILNLLWKQRWNCVARNDDGGDI